MRCIAIDDEPLALSQITGYVTKTPFLELVAACPGAFAAKALLDEQKIDLLFVDINMPDLNGLDFVRSLQPCPLVIFTTAYSEYAIDGFKVDALDYLLKPISYPDFLRAAEKAQRQYTLLNAVERDATPAELFVHSEYKIRCIPMDDIIYIESRGEYLRIYTESGVPVMTLGSLKAMEKRLPPVKFMRVHRSYIINLQKITVVERRHVKLTSGTLIPVGEQHWGCFKLFLEQHAI